MKNSSPPFLTNIRCVLKVVIALFEINISVWLVRCHVTSNKTVMTCPAEVKSFNVAHSDDAIMHLVA